MIFLITRNKVKTGISQWVMEIYVNKLMCEKKETMPILK